MRTAAISGRYRPFLAAPIGGVVFLCHGNGVSGGAQFVDDAKAKAISLVGTGITTTTANSKFNGSSIATTATGYLSVPDSPDWKFGAGDFTVDLWYWPNTLPGGANYQGLVGVRANSGAQSWSLLVTGDDASKVMFDSTLGTARSSASLVLNRWNHILVTRRGAAVYVAVNGKFGTPLSVGVQALPNIVQPLTVGVLSTDISNHYANGNLAEIRIIKGLSIGVTDFTPPVAPSPGNPSLAAKSIVTDLRAWWGMDASDATTTYPDAVGSNNLTVSDGTTTSALTVSGKRNRGTNLNQVNNRALYVPRTNTNLDLPNSNFSFGGWMTLAGTTGVTTFLMGRVGSGVGNTIQAFLQYNLDTNAIQAVASPDGSAASQVVTPSITATPGTLGLVFLTFNRTLNQLECRVRYPGGSLLKTTVAFPSALFTGATDANFTIGSAMSGNNTFYSPSRPGIGIGDECLVVNRAVTDTEFNYLFNEGAGKTYLSAAADSANNQATDPDWAAVQLLLKFEAASGAILPSAFVDNSQFQRTPTAVLASAAISNLSSKFGSTSLLCGNGRLQYDASSFLFDTPTFTIECWVNYTGIAETRAFIFGTAASNGGNGRVSIYRDGTDNLMTAAVVIGGVQYFAKAATITSATGWVHIALVRNGTGLTLYLGGVPGTTTTIPAGNADAPLNMWAVGGLGEYTAGGVDTSTGDRWVGYIDEFRISYVARYTAAFTPSATQFPAA